MRCSHIEADLRSVPTELPLTIDPLFPKGAGWEAAGGAVITQAAVGQAAPVATVGLPSRPQPGEDKVHDGDFVIQGVGRDTHDGDLAFASQEEHGPRSGAPAP